MIKYDFYKWDAFNDGNVDFLIKVEEPYSYLGTMFEGKEKREDTLIARICNPCP